MTQTQTPPNAAGIRSAPCVGYFILYIGLLVFTLCTGIVPAQSASQSTAPQNKHLVAQGVARYKQKDLDGALKALQQAEVLFPDNYAVPYYLGLIHLEKDQRVEAISQWKRYLRLAPHSENATQIKKLSTLLLCREAAEKARMALTSEAEPAEAETKGNMLAITAFQNMGSPNLNHLGKGMAALLISDLSKVPGLQVVERIKLQAMLQELKMGASGLVEVQTAPRIGRLLKARYVSTGSFADITKDHIEIAGITIDADNKKAVGSQQASGTIDVFFILEKQIACGILKSIDRDCNIAPKDFHQMHTKSLPAFVAFSEGLDHFDQRQYDDARKKFQQALKKDPEFDLARKYLAATPSNAMLFWNTSQMVTSLSASGIPSAAGGSATTPGKSRTDAAAGKATVGLATAGKAKTGAAATTKTRADAAPAAKNKTGADTTAKTKTDAATAVKSKADAGTTAKKQTGAATAVKSKADAGTTAKKQTGAATAVKSKADADATVKKQTGTDAAAKNKADADTAAIARDGTDDTAITSENASTKVNTTAIGASAGDTVPPEETSLSSKYYAIAGGVVAVAGGLALAGGGGGGGGGGDTPAAPQEANVASLAGDWNGDFSERTSGAGDNGFISMRLNQDENRLTGTGSFSGSNCFSDININGTVSGQTVAMDISGGSGSARFEGTFSNPTMSGTLRFTSGSCEGRVYEMSSELLSSAVVTW